MNNAKKISALHFESIRRYLKQNYIGGVDETAGNEKFDFKADAKCAALPVGKQEIPFAAAGSCPKMDMAPEEGAAPPELQEYLKTVKDESFAQMLFRKIDEKGIKDSECYKKAGVDKRLFSKIRSNPLYKPSKQTALAFACALELAYPEACELLKKAGFAFSPANKGDLIVEYYIKKGIFDLIIINQSLYDFDQQLLGSSME